MPGKSEPNGHDRAELMRSVKTIVLKVGTNVLSREAGGMALGRIYSIIEEIADLHRQGYRIILVSSGAVSMGMHRLNRDDQPALLSEKQAFASVGQIRLMSVYQQALGNFGIAAGQILLTEDDFSNRERYLNLRNTMHQLLEFGVVPIVNENDSVSTLEIEESVSPRGNAGVFGDNDKLSALVTSKLGADLLLILTDVDGLYPDGPPSSDGQQQPLNIVTEITADVEAMAGSGNTRGRGGMRSKLAAIKVAVQSGSLAVITSGRRQENVRDVLAGEEIGTLFLPQCKLHPKKRWIAFASATSGSVRANAGAIDAITYKNKSLLFAGVTSIDSRFEKGDVITISDESGDEVARGIANLDSSEAESLLGKRSSEIFEIAGHNYVELVHRDNLVVKR